MVVVSWFYVNFSFYVCNIVLFQRICWRRMMRMGAGEAWPWPLTMCCRPEESPAYRRSLTSLAYTAEEVTLPLSMAAHAIVPA